MKFRPSLLTEKNIHGLIESYSKEYILKLVAWTFPLPEHGWFCPLCILLLIMFLFTRPYLWATRCFFSGRFKLMRHSSASFLIDYVVTEFVGTRKSLQPWNRQHINNKTMASTRLLHQTGNVLVEVTTTEFHRPFQMTRKALHQGVRDPSGRSLQSPCQTGKRKRIFWFSKDPSCLKDPRKEPKLSREPSMYDYDPRILAFNLKNLFSVKLNALGSHQCI